MKKNNKEITKAIVSKRKGYSVELKYSKKAIEKELIKFTTKGGLVLEIPANELIEILITGVNREKLEPVFVNSETIDIVYVERALNFVADRNIKKGEKFNVTYKHPYPLEFAAIEDALKLCKIDIDSKVYPFTPDLLKKIKKKNTDEQKNFVKKFFTRILNKTGLSSKT